MNEPHWLRREWVDALHFQQLKRLGGSYGVRDECVIKSALARPVNQCGYGQVEDIVALASAYGFGLCRGHGYSDGNKRIAFMAMAVFLDINGWVLEAPVPEVVVAMLGVAAGEISEADLVSWLRQHVQRQHVQAAPDA